MGVCVHADCLVQGQLTDEEEGVLGGAFSSFFLLFDAWPWAFERVTTDRAWRLFEFSEERNTP